MIEQKKQFDEFSERIRDINYLGVGAKLKGLVALSAPPTIIV